MNLSDIYRLWQNFVSLNGYVANTDYEWYRFLESHPELDEINFWLPRDTRSWRAIPVGAPFFFKLKRPYYAICGFGFFAGHSVLPAWLAWKCFSIGNGAATFQQMRQRIERLRREQNSDPAGNYNIGCLMISQPTFFKRDEWIDQPSNWHANVVQGTTYDLSHGEGERIWEECLTRASSRPRPISTKDPELPLIAFPPQRYGSETIVRPRLGQGAFRVAVLDAYNRACAVSQEHSLPALESAHIKPYAESGTHHISNGLLLRADIHRLFDLGYVTVTPNYRFEVSERLRQDYSNGRSYYPLRGKEIYKPRQPELLPDPAFLEWHNHERFLG